MMFVIWFLFMLIFHIIYDWVREIIVDVRTSIKSWSYLCMQPVFPVKKSSPKTICLEHPELLLHVVRAPLLWWWWWWWWWWWMWTISKLDGRWYLPTFATEKCRSNVPNVPTSNLFGHWKKTFDGGFLLEMLPKITRIITESIWGWSWRIKAPQ